MRGLVIWNTYAQTLVIKRLGIVELCLADSNNFQLSIYFVPFLYKTEIYSLARVTKIKNMVKDGAYNYITSLYLTCVYK